MYNIHSTLQQCVSFSDLMQPTKNFGVVEGLTCLVFKVMLLTEVTAKELLIAFNESKTVNQ